MVLGIGDSAGRGEGGGVGGGVGVNCRGGMDGSKTKTRRYPKRENVQYSNIQASQSEEKEEKKKAKGMLKEVYVTHNI